MKKKILFLILLSYLANIVICKGQVKELEFNQLYILKASSPSTVKEVMAKNGFTLLKKGRTENNQNKAEYYYSNNGRIPFEKANTFIDFEYKGETAVNQSRVFYIIPSKKYFYKCVADLVEHGYKLMKIEKFSKFDVYEYADNTLFIMVWEDDGDCFVDIHWAKH